jgi:hypothetical protein
VVEGLVGRGHGLILAQIPSMLSGLGEIRSLVTENG